MVKGKAPRTNWEGIIVCLVGALTLIVVALLAAGWAMGTDGKGDFPTGLNIAGLVGIAFFVLGNGLLIGWSNYHDALKDQAKREGKES